ncbi:hypothetical protein INT45_011915 [Circinella minor]|uniref:Reverse transcriptase domain-containing protein n=1 Tax=Circinella minor TaxID=1195481 RepID=A0A8H7VFN6_9FUNG|nr:hypothetical protein INT45_011915 [Circinella minor]
MDTGSTLTSIRANVAQLLELPIHNNTITNITYSNGTTQTSSSKATLIFQIDSITKTMATAYVVQHQEEALILGMDWMVNEDIILRPKTKTVIQQQTSQQQNNMDQQQQVIIKQILNKYPQLTEETTTQNIAAVPYKHIIDTGDHPPIVIRDYRRSPAEKAIIDELIQDMLEKNVIQPSNSPWQSQLVLIRKGATNQFRCCVDFRAINKVTRRDNFPLPNIMDLLDKLHGSKYFSTLDLRSGYWQLPMDPNSMCKTAFSANGNLYEFRCLPYGCTNGPASFQRCMHYILQGQQDCMVYLDDILLHTRGFQEHITRIDELLALLNKHNLRLSPKKCHFLQTEVRYLGFIITGDGINPDPTKVETIANWPIPKNSKDVSKFIGFCAFHHRFLYNLSATAAPLYKLLRKSSPFQWSKTEQDVR